MDSGTLNKKIELIQWLSALEDKKLIDRLFKFRMQENQDWWNNLFSGEQESIERGIADSESEKLSNHAEVKKRYEKWL